MPNQHSSPMLGWHPPAELSGWVRAEAKRRGVPYGEILTEAVENYRTGRPRRGAGSPPVRLGLGPFIYASEPGTCSECKLGIREGALMRADENGGTLCHDCGRAANGWTP